MPNLNQTNKWNHVEKYRKQNFAIYCKTCYLVFNEKKRNHLVFVLTNYIVVRSFFFILIYPAKVNLENNLF